MAQTIRTVQRMHVWVPSADAIDHLGELPPDTELVVWDGGPDLPDSANEVRFVVPHWSVREPMGSLLAGLPHLEVVQVLNAGVNGIIDRVGPHVTVCNAGAANAASVADWCAAAILSELRLFPIFEEQQRRNTWRSTVGPALSTQRVAIVGYGAIGTALHDRLAPFGFQVLPFASRKRTDGRGTDVLGIDDLPGLLPTIDVVVLLTPLSERTHHLVGAEFLAALHDGAIVVNAARGPVVDTDALLTELTSKRLRAVLDVTDPEPLPSDHPLWTATNVRITPHVAGGTYSFFAFTYPVVTENLWRYVRGEPLINVVPRP